MINVKQPTGKILITFVLIYTTLWFVERWLFENILEKTIRKAAENGIKISYVTLRASGFPDDLTFHLRSVNINFRGLVEIHSPGAQIKMGIFFPFKQYFQCIFEDITGGTFLKNFSFTAFRVRTKFFLKEMRLYGLKVDADAFITVHHQNPVVEMKPFRVHLEETFDKKMPVLHVDLRSSIKNWFGEAFIHTQLDVAAKLRISHYNVLLNSLYPFQAWHQKGGEFFIDHCQTRGKQIDFLGTGALNLNKGLFPHGKITLKTQGVVPFSHFVENSLGLNHHQINAFRFGLEGMLKRDAEGYTIIPLSLENGMASFLGVPFLRLPSLQ